MSLPARLASTHPRHCTFRLEAAAAEIGPAPKAQDVVQRTIRRTTKETVMSHRLRAGLAGISLFPISGLSVVVAFLAANRIPATAMSLAQYTPLTPGM